MSMPNVLLSIASQALNVRTGVEIKLYSIAICILRITIEVSYALLLSMYD